jgi:NAD(P)-dependent dehydrogenase (short-subunit alcohol dehydrogenase family)
MFKVKNLELVVITGVSRGIGKALAEQFLLQGAIVVGCARSVVDGDFQHENLTTYVVDVTNPAAIREWANYILINHGTPDMVIQCAGTVNAPADIENIDAEDIRKLMDVNFMGVTYGMQAFLPMMKKIDKGFIINISSGWGREGKEGLAPYCASKYALEGLVNSVAKELNSKVKVYALDPGDGIHTDMLNVCLPSYYPDAPTANDWAVCAYDYLHEMWKSSPSECSLTVDLSSLSKKDSE